MNDKTDSGIVREKIITLKKDLNAIILAHNYQRPEVQDIADITGDSLELSRAAAKTDYAVIVFCGVHFMAESASILSPDKTVLLPRSGRAVHGRHGHRQGPRKTHREFYTDKLGIAFEFADEFTLLDMKNKYPGVPVVAYVNTSAAVKAESDICCTSSNVVKSLNHSRKTPSSAFRTETCPPYAAQRTKKKIISWDGFCNVHHGHLDIEDVNRERATHPDAALVVHPECPPAIQDMADQITSTSGMLPFLPGSNHKEFIIGTKKGCSIVCARRTRTRNFISSRTRCVCPI